MAFWSCYFEILNWSRTQSHFSAPSFPGIRQHVISDNTGIQSFSFSDARTNTHIHTHALSHTQTHLRHTAEVIRILKNLYDFSDEDLSCEQRKSLSLSLPFSLFLSFNIYVSLPLSQALPWHTSAYCCGGDRWPVCPLYLFHTFHFVQLRFLQTF